jgi:hypothetical protein
MAAAPRAGKPTSIAPKSSARTAKKSTKSAKKKKASEG